MANTDTKNWPRKLIKDKKLMKILTSSAIMHLKNKQNQNQINFLIIKANHFKSSVKQLPQNSLQW